MVDVVSDCFVLNQLFSTRRHLYKLYKNIVGESFFRDRVIVVVNSWNELPKDTYNLTSL